MSEGRVNRVRADGGVKSESDCRKSDMAAIDEHQTVRHTNYYDVDMSQLECLITIGGPSLYDERHSCN